MTNYNTARINAFCANEDNFVAVEYSEERAAARNEKGRAANARRNAKAVAAQAASMEKAAGFAIGQIVAMKNKRMSSGPIVAIDGDKITVEIGGSIRKFTAAMLVAA